MDNNPPAVDKLDPLYRAVFDDPENGTPDNITQAGCLSLARLGKEAWNAWRQRYPARQTGVQSWENRADFSGFDFRKEFKEFMDFRGFVFGDGANFDSAQFGDYPSFTGAQFGDDAQFSDVKLGDHANFTGAQFGDHASFDGAQIGDGANFDDAHFGSYASFEGAQFGSQFCSYASFQGAQFGDSARFKGAQFGDRAHFDGAQFGAYPNFEGALFGDDTNFVGAKFCDRAFFDGVQFGDDAWFGGARFENIVSFAGAQFGNRARFDCAQFGDAASFAALTWAALTYRYSERPGGLDAAKAWAEERGLSPESFKSISFAGANFAGQVDFSGRAFEGRTSFGRLTYPKKVSRRNTDGKVVEEDLPEGQSVVFGQAPLFHNCKLHQDTTFDDAKFPKKPSTKSLSKNKLYNFPFSERDLKVKPRYPVCIPNFENRESSAVVQLIYGQALSACLKLTCTFQSRQTICQSD